MRTKFKMPRFGIAISVLLQGLLLATFAPGANAEPMSQPAPTGLLTFSNVRIESMTPAQAAAVEKPSTPASAYRAFKDKDSGKLRDQTPEEMVEEGAAVQRKAATAPAPAGTLVKSASGRAIMLLGESFMSDAVAVKDASGKLEWDCIGDKKAAARALAEGKLAKEPHHER
jgi:hypothetical protein